MQSHIQHPLYTSSEITPYALACAQPQLQWWGQAFYEHECCCFYTSRLTRLLTNGKAQCKYLFLPPQPPTFPQNEVSTPVLLFRDSPRAVLSLQLCPDIVSESINWPWPERVLPHHCLLEQAKKKWLVEGSDLESYRLDATCWLQHSHCSGPCCKPLSSFGHHCQRIWTKNNFVTALNSSQY